MGWFLREIVASFWMQTISNRKERDIEDDNRTAAPDSTVVRVALWRAMHQNA